MTLNSTFRQLVIAPLLACFTFVQAQEPIGSSLLHQDECLRTSAESEQGAWFESEAGMMGTEIRVELWHEDQAKACEVIADVMAEMRRIDAEMSSYIATSRLSELNNDGAKGFVEVGEVLFGLIKRSQGCSMLTGAAFDITYASAGRHYNYRKGVRPDSEALRKAVEAIIYRHLELDPRHYAVKFLHPRVYVDLGGIAKGHAVDNGIEILRVHGIEQGMVSAGGDSQIIGDRRGEPWVVVVLPLLDASISTSGDCEKFFIENGVRYHHIIDPVSGDSARQVRSVTVISSEGTAADALSISVFVMGPKDDIELINRLIGIDVIIVDGAGQMQVSNGLETMHAQDAAPQQKFAEVHYE